RGHARLEPDLPHPRWRLPPDREGRGHLDLGAGQRRRHAARPARAHRRHRPLRRRAERRLRRRAGSVRAAPVRAHSRTVRADGRHPGGPLVTQPHTILVVEDESSIASFISLYLKNAGYQVKAVGTGSAALNQVAAGMPSLIVLDLNLPDMDGIEICRRIRKSSDVPILMLTARDEDVDKIIGLEVGADDYLTK